MGRISGIAGKPRVSHPDSGVKSTVSVLQGVGNSWEEKNPQIYFNIIYPALISSGELRRGAGHTQHV